MAGPAPKTRSWSARENVHKPKGLHLIVTGLVQVTNTNKRPRLKESSERDPRHLGLALTIEDAAGPGLGVVCWKEAFFHKEVKANQYDSVTIRWDAGAIAQVRVVDDTESAQQAAAMMTAVNAKYGKAPTKPASAAPKAAPKKAKKAKKASKAAPKKAKKKAAKKAVAARAVKAVGGWAKGVKKALSSVMKPAKKTKKKAGKRKGKKRR